MNSSISNYFSSQNWVLSTGAERLPSLNLFYFEGASLDARNNQQLSEDFLSYRYKDSCLYFVVCDGVQQSIDASLAARLLGMSLLDILPTTFGEKKIIESFAEKLRLLIDKKILSSPIDENDDAYAFHVRARDEIGAQVKFACGVVDFKRKKVELYWAGDIRFIVYGKNSEVLSSWEKDNNQFWSTRGDYALDLDSLSWDMEDVSQVSITSDGIRENFKEILNQKAFLRNTKLINHRYEIGVDDISGLDIKIASDDHIDQLSSVRTVSLINNKSLIWPHVSEAEKYRIYHVRDNSIQHVAEIDSKQKSYLLPDKLDDVDFYVQAISSQAISSELSKPVHYVPVYDPIPEPLNPGGSIPISKPIKIKPEPEPFNPPPVLQPKPIWQPAEQKKVPLKPAPTLDPKPLWQPIVIGCGMFSLFLFIGAIGFLSIKSLLVPPPTLALIVASPTNFIPTPTFIDTVTPSITATLPILHPSFTFSVTSTDLTLTPNKTISPVATIDIILNACQNKTMLDEQGKWKKYQIQRYDTFYTLARIYNTTVEELKRANCYEPYDNILSIGKYLLVPVNE